MRRALVTGGSGFIGRGALEPLAARGFEVHAVTSSPPPVAASEVVWHQADLLQPSAAQTLLGAVEPSHLLHLAWYVAPGRFWTADENIDWVAASLRLLRAFAAGGGERAVVAGTCAEYAWGSDAPLDERSTALEPATLYGAAKHGLRVVAQALFSQHARSLGWGRIFFPFGPGEPTERLVPSVARAVLAGRAAPCTSGTQRRDFLHSADIAGALAALVDCPVEGAVNIGSGEPRSVAEIARTVAAAAGDASLLELGALPDRPGEPDVVVADVTRLREEVGFTPAASFEQRVAETVAWWREQ